MLRRYPITYHGIQFSRTFFVHSALLKRAPSTTKISKILRGNRNLKVRKHELKNYDEESASPKKVDTSYRSQLHEKVLPRDVQEPKKKQNSKLDDWLARVSHGSSSPAKQKLEAAIPLDPRKVPHLAHALERVLFSPGVHFFKDPRTQHYNFTPYLENIVKYEDFDFNRILSFVTVSKDQALLEQSIKSNKKYYSSTSSMTLALTQFYLFLNNYGSEVGARSTRFEFPRFTRTVLDLPASVIVLPKGENPATKETIYAVSSDKSADTEILLSAMGHCLEAFLTTSEEDFKQYLVDSPASEKKNQQDQNVYNYLAYGKFLMRSQLDCYDPRLPGNGTFDLKTRAVCAVRQDRASDASKNTYQIWRQVGDFESFSREYRDLIRSGALLKYGFQARIGQMDGIFVAYHNVNTFFGFQYLPLEDIDRVFYNDLAVMRSIVEKKVKQNKVTLPEDRLPSQLAELQFKASLDIWLDLMDRVVKDLNKLGYKNSTFRLILKRVQHPLSTRKKVHREKEHSELRVYVVPLTSAQEQELQSFSTNFKTSFREKITEEQRRQNLQEFQRQLHKLNMSLIEKAPLLGYRVTADHYLGGRLVKQQHVYPSHEKDEWQVKYRIHGALSNKTGVTENAVVKQGYEEVLKKVSSMLTSSMQPAGRPDKLAPNKPLLIDELRYFTRVGKLRQENWKSLKKSVIHPKKVGRKVQPKSPSSDKVVSA